MPPSTSLVLDTCSVLNLINGGSLSTVLKLPIRFFIGPIVHAECNRQPCPELEAEITGSRISVLNSSSIPVNVFSDLLSKYKLGDGETECLAFGKILGHGVCTDDRMARDSASSLIGASNVTGSIGLLKLAVENSFFECLDAYNNYVLMIKHGAFLPKLTSSFFCD